MSVGFITLNYPSNGNARRWWGLFCGVHGEGGGSESVVVGALVVIEEEFTGFSELESLYVELVVKVEVIRYMEDGPQFRVDSLFGLATLWADSAPLSLEGIDIVLPSAGGEDSAAHLLLESCGHRLFAGVGEVDAGHSGPRRAKKRRG